MTEVFFWDFLVRKKFQWWGILNEEEGFWWGFLNKVFSVRFLKVFFLEGFIGFCLPSNKNGSKFRFFFSFGFEVVNRYFWTQGVGEEVVIIFTEDHLEVISGKIRERG